MGPSFLFQLHCGFEATDATTVGQEWSGPIKFRGNYSSLILICWWEVTRWYLHGVLLYHSTVHISQNPGKGKRHLPRTQSTPILPLL